MAERCLRSLSFELNYLGVPYNCVSVCQCRRCRVFLQRIRRKQNTREKREKWVAATSRGLQPCSDVPYPGTITALNSYTCCIVFHLHRIKFNRVHASVKYCQPKCCGLIWPTRPLQRYLWSGDIQPATFRI